MPGRLVNKADFERLLGCRHWARSAHFAVHHLPTSPTRPAKPPKLAASEQQAKLSTAPAPVVPQAVDSLPAELWLGCVVPKRHARRSVTRSLLKRQVRAAVERHSFALPAGLWLVRLRQPFAAAEFVSARSEALARAARTELDGLFASAVR